MNETPSFEIFHRDGEHLASVPIQHKRFDVALLKANKVLGILAKEMKIPRQWLRLEYAEVEKHMCWTRPY